MFRGTVVSIHVAVEKGEPIRLVDAIEAIPGQGLDGDRYATRAAASEVEHADREVTLVESEALEALARDYGIEMAPWETRRNLATRDVPLNHLVGRSFRVGGATLEGLRLCEPCGYMERMSGKRVVPGLVHRGGLRARILSAGRIRVGDTVEPVSGSAPEPPGPPRA